MNEIDDATQPCDYYCEKCVDGMIEIHHTCNGDYCECANFPSAKFCDCEAGVALRIEYYANLCYNANLCYCGYPVEHCQCWVGK